MKILIKKELTHKCDGTFSEDGQQATSNLKEVFAQSMDRLCGTKKPNVEWLDDDTVVVDQLPGMALHNFTLEAEARGKRVTYEKQTIIHVR